MRGLRSSGRMDVGVPCALFIILMGAALVLSLPYRGITVPSWVKVVGIVAAIVLFVLGSWYDSATAWPQYSVEQFREDAKRAEEAKKKAADAGEPGPPPGGPPPEQAS